MSLLRRIEKGTEQGGSGDEPPGTEGNADAEHNPVDFNALAIRLRTELFAKLDPEIRDNPTPEARGTFEDLLDTILTSILKENNGVLKRGDKQKLFEPV